MNIELIIKKATNELKMSGIKTANLDVILFLEQVLKKDRAYILAHDLESLTNSEYSKFRKLILKRKQKEPVAYILGHKEFYGYNFFVNKNVLIPRPETELLVEQVINYVKCHPSRPRSDPRSEMSNVKYKEKISILDIGTGSGCIIISLILALKAKSSKLEADFFASDISKKALYVAKKNAKLHKVNDKIRFFHSDLFSNSRMPKKYDLIIANLPYVPKSNLKLKTNPSRPRQAEAENLKLNNEIYFEPENAIYAENNGTQIIKKFLNQAKSRINNDGLILIEVDPRNAKELFEYSEPLYINYRMKLIKDLSQKNRAIAILT